jgi:hypothetical protein
MATTNIYEQFDKATKDTTAVVLILDGQAIGRIVIKYGSAATAYVHIWGTTMQKGRATGYGYDKATAAVTAAVVNIAKAGTIAGQCGSDADLRKALGALFTAFEKDDGRSWDARLRDAGFTVAFAI